LLFRIPNQCHTSLGRIKMLVVAPEALIELFKATEPITLSFEGVPADARVIGVHTNPLTRLIYVFIESEAFPEVQPGAEPVQFPVNVTRHYVAAS
jgi:hypothetical protein